MDLFGAAPKRPLLPPKICHTYPMMMKLGTVIPYLKKIQKIYKFRDTPFEFCWHQHFFYRKSANFAISRNTDIDCILMNNFQFFLLVLSLYILFLINMITILIMSPKIATLGLLKIQVFWNKDSGVIISVHGVTNKILSRDSNYIVDEIMWPKFGNSSISISYHNFNFIRIWPEENTLFERWSCFKVNIWDWH